MIEQRDFNFSEEFLSFLPAEQQSVLRRIKALFEDERIVWEPGTQTFIVLDCLAEEFTYLADLQAAQIELKLLEKPEGPVAVSRHIVPLTEAKNFANISDIENL